MIGTAVSAMVIFSHQGLRIDKHKYNSYSSRVWLKHGLRFSIQAGQLAEPKAKAETHGQEPNMESFITQTKHR